MGYFRWQAVYGIACRFFIMLYFKKIDANGTEIRVTGDVVNEDAYISLTDIAKYKNPDNAFIVVANWMQSRMLADALQLKQDAEYEQQSLFI